MKKKTITVAHDNKSTQYIVEIFKKTQIQHSVNCTQTPKYT